MLVNRLCFLSIHFCFSKYRFIRTFVPDGRVTRVVVRQAHSGRRRIHDSVRSRIITPCLAFFDGRKYFFGFDERDREEDKLQHHNNNRQTSDLQPTSTQ